MYISHQTKKIVTQRIIEACAQKAGSQSAFAESFGMSKNVVWRAKKSGACSPKLFYTCVGFLGFKESVEIIEETMDSLPENAGTIEEYLKENG